MATSSRQSSIFGVNDWKSIYKTYSQADFQSYDYESLRKNFVDYLRAYYPETFNDYTESSEYVALLDIIAFMGQSMSFRDDLNTRENFIDTAERRDSVVKLANLVGYTPKRNIAGQGFLKVTSIQTTEQLKDINGINLSGLTVLWNDPANPNWQEQFNTVFNAALVDSQRVGKPGNSQTILDIKTDEYSIRLPPGVLPTSSFGSTIDGVNMAFECVSMTSINSSTLYEKPPAPSGVFNVLYRNDKLGFGSANTGFFMYFKQGTLGTYAFNIPEQISNQQVDINIEGINNTDTWLYQIDPTSNAYIPWTQVDSIYTQQTNNINKKIFSVVSRYNDQVTYDFGDGVFGEMPTGNFISYVRTGNALTYTIDPTEFTGIVINMRYVSRTGRTETLSMALELQLPVTTAQQRETLQNIKTRAPQRFYTQNRMVNGEDYNNFPFTLYSSIIKSKALNRVSVGVSRNFDLQDPSGKYSSTNDFADDGGIFVDDSVGFITFIPTSTGEIVNFLSETLSTVLNSGRVLQYYTAYYPWVYQPSTYNPLTTLIWNQTNFSSNETTGFFYNAGGPVQVGVYSGGAGGNTAYITEGALLKFTAPSGYYFDKNNQLKAGIPGPSDITYIWTSVGSVTGDGSNNGLGNLSNGQGPVVLNTTVPGTTILSAIIPSFTNLLHNTVIQDCITLINLNQNFSLYFNNKLLANQDRWSIGPYGETGAFVNFKSLGGSSYIVTYNSLAYYFASVNSVRFSYTREKIIYDPLSGKIMQDYVNVMKTNSQPFSNFPLSKDKTLYIIGQPVEKDGYVDDYAVEVSTANANLPGTLNNPEFFSEITNYHFGESNLEYFVFFQTVTDANMLTRKVMIPTSEIVYNYGLQSDINIIKYEYPLGTIFYAVFENNFYQSVIDPGTSANIYNLTQLTTYSAMTGRQGLYFQYKHISDNTTRINPATTNIVDLYVVTQSYYTQYQNWIKDTTGQVMKPSIPTINELTQLYSDLDNYKMLTDSVIINSVTFKPLFGNKAESNLQATIKVIKNTTSTASDSEIRTNVLAEINNYFTIDNWNFGDTFYFSELAAYLHNILGDYVNSVILVPKDPNLVFGDLYEIRSAPYEIFVNCAQATDIVIISSLTPAQLQSSASTSSM
jgi:hypothetical protein